LGSAHFEHRIRRLRFRILTMRWNVVSLCAGDK
jgi:hypothetical protein